MKRDLYVAYSSPDMKGEIILGCRNLKESNIFKKEK